MLLFQTLFSTFKLLFVFPKIAAMSTEQGNQTFTDIITVNHNMKEGDFEVRVIRKWKTPDYSKPGTWGGVQMVIMDKHVSV
jgi:hypothetical protein